MLRPRGGNARSRSPASRNDIDEYQSSKSMRSLFFIMRVKRIMPLLLATIIFGGLLLSFLPEADFRPLLLPAHTSNVNLKEFQGLIDRAIEMQQHCQQINTDHQLDLKQNNHTAHLGQFGILKAIEAYKANPTPYPYTCQVPPENECGETQFTVIFMAYNPDRLQKLYNQILKMLTDGEFSKLVREVIVVWNGERHVEETKLGKSMLDLGGELPFRISYPLKAGFPNDLMNRYHPRLEVKTKAIMYYDDDGPFYSYKATLGGFELWKRNSNAQVGAMARKLDLCKRQAIEKAERASGGSSEASRFFISQCPADELQYNYFEMANYGANMVLPSGSFLHSNYLCFLWHPLFEEIRQYVKEHPVHPDDGTTSAIISHVGGRAPRVYSRRINETNDQNPPHRRLMFDFDWDKRGDHNKKMFWAKLRADAANSLIRYFGSINSGSLGWCHGTPYVTTRKKGKYCEPEMAKIGNLPWMNEDGTAKSTCP